MCVNLIKDKGEGNTPSPLSLSQRRRLNGMNIDVSVWKRDVGNRKREGTRGSMKMKNGYKFIK